MSADLEDRLRRHYTERAAGLPQTGPGLPSAPSTARCEGVHTAEDTANDLAEYAPAVQRRRPPLLTVAAALVLVVSVAWVAVHRAERPQGAANGAPFNFVTQMVSFHADVVRIDVAGRTFSPLTDVTVSSDGAEHYETLELQWFENGIEMRLNLYFRSDDTAWWINRVDVYNGQPQGDQASFEQNMARILLGEDQTGRLDLTIPIDGTQNALVTIEGLRLRAFLGTGLGGVSVPTAATLPVPAIDPGRVPARPTDVPPTGAVWQLNDLATIELAVESIAHACMAERGWQYPTPTPIASPSRSAPGSRTRCSASAASPAPGSTATTTRTTRRHPRSIGSRTP